MLKRRHLEDHGRQEPMFPDLELQLLPLDYCLSIIHTHTFMRLYGFVHIYKCVYIYACTHTHIYVYVGGFACMYVSLES